MMAKSGTTYTPPPMDMHNTSNNIRQLCKEDKKVIKSMTSPLTTPTLLRLAKYRSKIKTVMAAMPKGTYLALISPAWSRSENKEPMAIPTEKKTRNKLTTPSEAPKVTWVKLANSD